MDFKEYLDTTAGELNKEIQKILNGWLKEVEGIDGKLVPLAKAFIKACDGGKRIRGALVKLGYELAGKQSQEIIKVAAAYEIFHASILAHDDIIDQSEIRRGNPSLYKKLGIPKAITLGDLGFFLAIRAISQSNFPEKFKNQALKLFSKTVLDTAIGQLLDIEKGDPIITAKLKTARYTISGPLQLGAILAGVQGELIRQLGKFGESLGIAFQIRDDILDGESYRLEKAKKYVDSAKKMIPELTKSKKMSRLLERMSEYLLARDQ